MQRGLLGLWLLAATLLTTRYWLTHPEALPRLPEAFWLWAIETVGSRDGEDLAKLELLTVSVISLAIVALATVLILTLWRRLHRR